VKFSLKRTLCNWFYLTNFGYFAIKSDMRNLLNITAGILLCSFFLVGILSNYSQAQEITNEPVNIPLRALPSSKAEITYTHEKLKNGRGNKAKITASFEIRNTGEDGFVASWTTKSVQLGDLLIDETSPQAGSMFIGVPIYFLAGTDGGPIKLQDKEKLIAQLPNSAAFVKADTQIVDQVISFFESMDEETLAQVLFKVPSFMSICQETNFIVDEANNFLVESPSPFGEGVLVANVSYKLTSLDIENNIAKLEYRSQFDAESVKQLAIQSLEKLAPDMPPSQKDIDELVIDRLDSADCMVDMSTGWVTKMTYSILVKSSDIVQKETYEIFVNWEE